ncbi:MAG: hypothetical protein ACQESN_08745 [Thermotogota bacterium]
MVKVKRSYKKDGVDVPLKYPQIRIGNNLGEDEEVIVTILDGINVKNIEYKGKTFDAYNVKADYNNEVVYVRMSAVPSKKLIENGNYIDKQVIFKKTIADNGRTNIKVFIDGEELFFKNNTTFENTDTDASMTKEQLLKIYLAEKKKPSDIVIFNGKKDTYENILGKEVLETLK